MRLELTRVGLLMELANHYTTTGAQASYWVILIFIHVCVALSIRNPPNSVY